MNASFVETSRVEVTRDTVRYELDPWGNQIKLIYPDLSVVTKTYDALNRPLTVTDSTGTTTYSYSTPERKVVETRPDGDIKTTISNWGRITSLVSAHYDELLDTQVADFEQTLSYDEVGNVIHEVRVQNGITTLIDNQYNSRGELTQSSQEFGLNTVVYRYLTSPYGNKSEIIDYYYDGELAYSKDRAYVYNHLNQLERSTIDGSSVDYTYDATGNLIEEHWGSNLKTYAYDLNNRLISVEEGTQSLQFSYDGSGNRLSKNINGSKVAYVNDTSLMNEQVLSYKVGQEVTNISYGLNRLNEDGYKGEVHDSTSLVYLRACYYNPKLTQFISFPE